MCVHLFLLSSSPSKTDRSHLNVLSSIWNLIEQLRHPPSLKWKPIDHLGAHVLFKSFSYSPASQRLHAKKALLVPKKKNRPRARFETRTGRSKLEIEHFVRRGVHSAFDFYNFEDKLTAKASLTRHDKPWVWWWTGRRPPIAKLIGKRSSWSRKGEQSGRRQNMTGMLIKQNRQLTPGSVQLREDEDNLRVSGAVSWDRIQSCALSQDTKLVMDLRLFWEPIDSNDEKTSLKLSMLHFSLMRARGGAKTRKRQASEFTWLSFLINCVGNSMPKVRRM